MNEKNIMGSQQRNYGDGDVTYQAVGGLQGIKKLVTDFYQIMDKYQDYKIIRDMHPENLELSVDKLVSFLSGWVGSEPLYFKKYQGAGMPKVHMHISIEVKERDMWLSCMNEALHRQNYPNKLIDYLNKEFTFPAESIHQVCKTQAITKNSKLCGRKYGIKPHN